MGDELIRALAQTFFISMVPVVELRGAVPIAIAQDVPPLLAIAVACVGNLIPIPFILLFIRKIFAWIRRRIPKLDGLVTKLEKRAEGKSETVRKYTFWGLFFFVAIPLPGTGAWTGALIAAMLEMRLKTAIPAIALGVVTAGIVMCLASLGVVHIFA